MDARATEASGASVDTVSDSAADFDGFCRSVSPRLFGALVLQCDDRATAEELAQEALSRAWERWETVHRAERPEHWVFRVAFNLAASDRRRRQAARRAHERLGRPDDISPDSSDRAALRGALEELPPRQRAAVVLRHYAGFSVAEAAATLECAEGTVKSLTSQGLDRLRAVLDVEVTRDG
jgi:RNA polymerase sigma-70 factor (ECF subfamily)